MKTVEINHIAKIAGHLRFVGAIGEDNFALARIETDEGVRFMEAMVLNRYYEEVPIITSRICGSCSIAHNLAAIFAVEQALAIHPNLEISLLREALMHAQWIYSHSLQTFFLSSSDVIGTNSNLDFIKSCSAEAKLVLEIRSFGGRLAEVIGGRVVHPINSVIGGFRVVPDWQKFLQIKNSLPEILNKAVFLFEKVSKSSWPNFYSKSLFASLESREHYPFWSERMKFSDGLELNKNEFLGEIEELSSPNEKVKRVLKKQKPFFVGALARINNSYGRLSPLAKKCFDSLNIELPTYNPFYNFYAQVVEIINSLQELIPILDKIAEFLNRPNVEKKLLKTFVITAGKGSALIEAPRGLLYHEYEIAKDGRIMYCNIITPTVISLANLEKDLRHFLPEVRQLSEAQAKQWIRMLILAYDPCVGCATH
ncbi:MAG: nickel-dependent hydrogenase large subunit [Patescibacteria group bacterium]